MTITSINVRGGKIKAGAEAHFIRLVDDDGDECGPIIAVLGDDLKEAEAIAVLMGFGYQKAQEAAEDDEDPTNDTVLTKAEHDRNHNFAELIFAAEAYQQYARCQLTMMGLGFGPFSSTAVPDYWPWEPKQFKPSDDIQRNLEKAGALIDAAIDRVGAQKEAS